MYYDPFFAAAAAAASSDQNLRLQVNIYWNFFVNFLKLLKIFCFSNHRLLLQIQLFWNLLWHSLNKHTQQHLIQQEH